MDQTPGPRHGGRILIDQLAAQGVRRVFLVPGESFLAALDGLHGSGLDAVVCRQEGGTAMMAEAEGKLTGRPGVAFVTRGPGATNASAGIHVARHDSTPMILFVGQIARGDRDRDAFQEVDFRAMFGPLAKWVAEIDAVERIPEYVSRAVHVAMSGRPGPVVLSLPEDMLAESAAVPDAPRAEPPCADLSAAALEEALSLIDAAERPLMVLGGGVWSAEAAAAVARFAEARALPVGTAFRRQDHIDNRSAAYAGHVGLGMDPSLMRRLREADLVIALGARLGELSTGGFTALGIPAPTQRLLHIHPDPGEIGRLYTPTLGLAASPVAAALALAGAPAARPPEARREAFREARADYEAWTRPEETPGALKMERVIAHLSATLPEDAIVTNGAGNYAAWLHRYFVWKRFRTQLAPTSGSMGYGLPAAVAAKLADPAREVVALAGDGCFQMTMQEFGVAAERGAAVLVIVADNGRYGTIRMHQEKHYPGRVSGTGLVNPDFAALARAYGGHGETVTADADFPPALERARASGRPAILHLKLDPRALAPRLSLPE